MRIPLIATLGASIFLSNTSGFLFGTLPKALPSFSGQQPFQFFDVSVLPQSLWLLAGLPDAAERKASIGRLRAQDRRARLEGRVEKEGLFTGRYATNPFTGERIPIWVGNFVLMGYGTGAIMSVPAHDQRDLEFARRYQLEVRVVVQRPGEPLDGATLTLAWDGPGRLVRSGPFDGLASEEAIPRMAAWAQEKGIGKAAVTYRLKDWLISRQRYWGTPIPVVYCDEDGMVPVPEDPLPIVLPKDAPFTGEGGNPPACSPTKPSSITIRESGISNQPNRSVHIAAWAAIPLSVNGTASFVGSRIGLTARSMATFSATGVGSATSM